MLKQLKYFQSVVRLNSFSEAAEENFISQSAISQQVQALERELGFRLLERKNRSFTYITVKEICEAAGVNRSTFYLHYETMADLLSESAQYIIDRFVKAMPQVFLPVRRPLRRS